MGKSLLENVREGMAAQVPARADAFGYTWGEMRAGLLEPPSVPEALMEMMAQAEADMQSIMYSTGVERLPPHEPAHAARIDVGEGRVSSLVVATEAPVTDGMVADGLAASPVVALRDYEVAAIYRAMANAAPVELYRADERKIDALTAQRDAWTGIAVRYKGRIHALEAENFALKAQIAAFTAANVAKPADARKPMPANALAGRRDDPRRIGS